MLTATLLLSAIIVYLLREIHVIGSLYSYYARSTDDVGPITLAGALFLGSIAGVTPIVGFVLGYVDTLAAIFGTWFVGTRKNTKTIYGLVGGYVGATIVFVLLRGFYPFVLLLPSLLLAPLVEYYSDFDDNLVLSLFLVGFKVATSV